MRFPRLLRTAIPVCVLTFADVANQAACAASPAVQGVLAKSWAVGYAIFGLAVLLGVLAVTVTSKRKTIRKRD